MIEHWILDERGRPVRATTKEFWEWFWVEENRIRFVTMVDHVRVSTIFLGIDHGFGQTTTPIFWETMARGEGLEDSPQDRCGGSREQAEEMHYRMVRQVREALGLPATEEVKNGD